MVATLAVLGRRASYAEYLALPDDLRAEYVNGQILVNPPPSYSHQRTCQRLYRLLAATVPPDLVAVAVGWQVGSEPPQVRIPDVAVLSHAPAGPLITQAPLVVIEVLSTNRRDDLVRKAVEYRDAGVGQYWLVDPREEELDVLANSTTGWEPLVQLTRDAPIGSVSIVGFGAVQLSLGDLLDG